MKVAFMAVYSLMMSNGERSLTQIQSLSHILLRPIVVRVFLLGVRFIELPETATDRTYGTGALAIDGHILIHRASFSLLG